METHDCDKRIVEFEYLRHIGSDILATGMNQKGYDDELTIEYLTEVREIYELLDELSEGRHVVHDRLALCIETLDKLKSE